MATHFSYLVDRTARIRFSLLAVLLFVTIVCLVMGWKFRPQKYAAVAFLKIEYWNTSEASDQPYEVFCKAQKSLMASDFVINATLARKRIASLECVASREEPAKWLSDELEVSFPEDGELMRVALSGGSASMPEYCQLIDAIIESYMNEIVFNDKTRRSVARESKKISATHLRLELSVKMNRLEALREELGSAQSTEPAEIQLLQAEVNTMTELWKELRTEIMREEQIDRSRESRIRLLQPATSSRL